MYQDVVSNLSHPLAAHTHPRTPTPQTTPMIQHGSWELGSVAGSQHITRLKKHPTLSEQASSCKHTAIWGVFEPYGILAT